MFFGHYWGRHGSISGIHSVYQDFKAVRFWPRGSGNPGFHQEAEKNGPRDTETTGQSPKIRGQSPKIRGKGEFLTDLGIDRLHPELKIDFLGPGTLKTA